jgi:hypothetical protein
MRHSYTKISMYMECPAKKRYKYDERRAVEQSPSAARGTRYHSAIEQSLGGDSTVPGTAEFPELGFYSNYLARLRDNGAKAEYKFAITREWTPTLWESNDAWLIGVADVWIPTAPVAHVQDWKTGKIYDSHEKQGEFYATCLFSEVAEAYEVKATFIYTDLKKERNKTYHRNLLPELRQRWTARIERMERDTECAPTPSYGCKWCSFSKAKGGPCIF